MKKRYLLYFIAIFFTSSFLLKTLSFSSLAQTNSTILVSAAASLKDALQEIKVQFQKNHSSIKVEFNLGSSGSLQQQIEQGAPVDVFISAASREMDALASKRLIDKDTRKNLLTNRLALIIPSNDKGSKIKDFSSLTRSEVKKIAIGEPHVVPCGFYSVQVFNRLKIAGQLQSKLVYANSVREVLSLVEMGNVDAGLVYTTDARISNKVKIVTISAENLHSPIIYSMAIIQSSRNPQASGNFVQFLTSSVARKIFQKYGFGVL